VIERTRGVTGTKLIVVCTTTLAEDDIVEEIAAKSGVKCFRGSIEDKLDRWLKASQAFDIDYFVTVDGDDLFCDPHLIDLAISQIAESPCDMLKAPSGIACGAFTYCIRTAALVKVCSMKASTDTEMMSVYFTDTGIFEVRDLQLDSDAYLNSKVRLTLDYPEDLLFFSRVFDVLDAPGNRCPLIDILKLLEARPELSEINFFRQSEFLANQKQRTNLQLSAVPAEPVPLPASNSWRFRGNELRYVKEVLDSGFGSSTSGTMNTQFEAEFARRFGTSYAITSNSGTSTLHQALAAAGVGPGDEVIVPALTVVMCGLAVLHAGATPVFADVDPHTFLLDPRDVERKITARTKAIMPVHLYGGVCDMDSILALADRHDLFVLEDCAQCFLGTDRHGRIAGTIGHAGSFSLENSKHISTGDGGILITSDEALAERMRKFGGLGFKNIKAKSGQVRKNKDSFQDPLYLRHDTFGYNYRLTEVAAAVGKAQLEQLDEFVNKRVQMAAGYLSAIEGCDWLEPQVVPEGSVNSYYTFGVKFLGNERRGVSWYDFRRSFIELGGDGIYSAWALVYNEPIMQTINSKGDFFPSIHGQALAYKGMFTDPACPVAEELQPKLMQFTTNQGHLADVEKQVGALRRAIERHD